MNERNRALIIFIIMIVLVSSFSYGLLETRFWNLVNGILTYNGDVKILGNLTVDGDYVNVTVIDMNVTRNLNVDGNITADYYFGDGSELTGISGGNPFNQSLNTTDNPQFVGLSLQNTSTATQNFTSDSLIQMMPMNYYSYEYADADGVDIRRFGLDMDLRDLGGWKNESDGDLRETKGLQFSASFAPNTIEEADNVNYDAYGAYLLAQTFDGSNFLTIDGGRIMNTDVYGLWTQAFSQVHTDGATQNLNSYGIYSRSKVVENNIFGSGTHLANSYGVYSIAEADYGAPYFGTRDGTCYAFYGDASGCNLANYGLYINTGTAYMEEMLNVTDSVYALAFYDDGVLLVDTVGILNNTGAQLLFLNITGTLNVSDNVNVIGNTTSFWFKGLFNWTEFSRFLSFDGQILDYNETQLNDSIDEKLATTTYYPTSYAELEGTLSGGNNIGNLSFYDNQLFNITEGSGANSIDFYVNFTNITDFSSLKFREYYIGSSSHNIKVYIYDYDESIWEEYGEFQGQAGFNVFDYPVDDADEHIQNQTVQVRFEHIENGIASHKLIFDYIQLIKGFGVSSTSINTEEFLAIDGRRSLTNNWNQGIYNLTNTNSWFLGNVNWTSIQNVDLSDLIDNDTIIRSYNTSWLNSSQDIWDVIDNSTFLKILDLSSSIDNDSIIRSYNTSWLATELDNDSIIRSGNTSWITDNQGYNTTEDMKEAVNNGLFYGYRDTEYNTGGVNYELIALTDIDINDDEYYFNYSDGHVAVQKAGIYNIDAQCVSDLDSGTREFAQCGIYINDAVWDECSMYMRELTSPGTGCSVFAMKDLNVNDNISIWFRCDTANCDLGGSADITKPAALRIVHMR